MAHLIDNIIVYLIVLAAIGAVVKYFIRLGKTDGTGGVCSSCGGGCHIPAEATAQTIQISELIRKS